MYKYLVIVLFKWRYEIVICYYVWIWIWGFNLKKYIYCREVCIIVNIYVKLFYIKLINEYYKKKFKV